MKKIFALLLVSILLLSVAACSTGGSENPDTTGGPSGDVESSQTGSTEENTIVVWAWDALFNVAAFNEATEIYKKINPDVNVEIVEMSQDDTVSKLNTILSSGQTKGLPNVLPIEDYRIQNFLQSYPGAIKEMTDEVDYTQFAPYKIPSMTHEGKIYGVPFDTGASLMYYRKDVIEQVGYTEEQMKTLDWDQFMDLARLVAKETDFKLMGHDPANPPYLRLLQQSIGVWIVGEDGTPNIAGNPGILKSLELHKTMLDEDLAYITSGWGEGVGALNNGNVATAIAGCWYTPSVTQGEDQNGLWRVAPIPKLNVPEGTHYGSDGGGSVYIFDNLPATATTVEYIKATFGSSEDFYKALLDNHGIQGTFLPVIESDSYNVDVEFFGGQKIYKEVGEIMENIPGVNYGKDTYQFQDAVVSYLDQFMSGAMTAEEVLIAAQKDAESFN